MSARRAAPYAMSARGRAAAAARCEVVAQDGRARVTELAPDAQAAVFTRTVHRTAGLVEILGVVRGPDARPRIPSKRRDRADFVTAGDAAAFQARVRHHSERGREVWAGIATKVAPSRAGEAVRGGSVLWVDIDDTEPGAALSRLGPLRPHLLVASGGGVHAYWLLDRVVGAATIESGNRRIAAAVGGDRQSTDRNRAMRVPGTINHKHGRACRIVRLDLARRPVDPRALQARLADPKPRRPRAARPRPAPTSSRAEELTPAEYFRALCGLEPDAAGYVRCPLPDHEDRTPSCKLYADHWHCYGCGRHGSIYDLASLLEGGPWGRGLNDRDRFLELKARVHARLGLPEPARPRRR
jgi:RepB DNA-primase from phage plasmid